MTEYTDYANYMDRLALECSNDKYDFYYTKSKLGAFYYCMAFVKGTTLRVTMAGFNTRKSARHCATVWVTWMGV